MSRDIEPFVCTREYNIIFEMDAAEDMSVCKYYPLESHMPKVCLTREEDHVELIILFRCHEYLPGSNYRTKKNSFINQAENRMIMMWNINKLYLLHRLINTIDFCRDLQTSNNIICSRQSYLWTVSCTYKDKIRLTFYIVTQSTNRNILGILGDSRWWSGRKDDNIQTQMWMRNMNVNTYICMHVHPHVLPAKGLATFDDQIVDLGLVVESEMPNAPKRRINLVFTPFDISNVTVYVMQFGCANIQRNIFNCTVILWGELQNANLHSFALPPYFPIIVFRKGMSLYYTTIQKTQPRKICRVTSSSNQCDVTDDVIANHIRIGTCYIL